jgi:hypothetical protein
MVKKEAIEITGGLTSTSKMPCNSYSLSPFSCKTGNKLCKKEGSICKKCYARKGFYSFPHIKKVQQKRLKSIDKDNWENAMVFLIKNSKKDFFRWHDSGDIQSIKHLKKIVNIARRLPKISFWLPTKETKMVQLARKKGVRFPKNITIRHSTFFIGAAPDKTYNRLNTSTVNSNIGFDCPVRSNKENCNTFNCRACWNKTIKNINFHLH